MSGTRFLLSERRRGLIVIASPAQRDEAMSYFLVDMGSWSLFRAERGILDFAELVLSASEGALQFPRFTRDLRLATTAFFPMTIGILSRGSSTRRVPAQRLAEEREGRTVPNSTPEVDRHFNHRVLRVDAYSYHFTGRYHAQGLHSDLVFPPLLYSLEFRRDQV